MVYHITPHSTTFNYFSQIANICTKQQIRMFANAIAIHWPMGAEHAAKLPSTGWSRFYCQAHEKCAHTNVSTLHIQRISMEHRSQTKRCKFKKKFAENQANKQIIRTEQNDKEHPHNQLLATNF